TGVSPSAAYGVALPRSQGKDSTTGHWEICGVVLKHPFPTYPNGFPTSLLDDFARRTGRGWLGNTPASGTRIIAELGEEHQRTGKWIVYTSADSVFQVAAHEYTVPPEELYRACRVARELLAGEHAVSRVIARPFTGRPGAYLRTPGRRDFSIEPVGETLLDRLAAAGVPRVGIGKVDDLFADRNITSEHTPTNADAYRPAGRAAHVRGPGRDRGRLFRRDTPARGGGVVPPGDADLSAELARRARAVKQHAYCPYSKFRVGAALEAADGGVYVGTNVESASYGLTICAERMAIGAAVADGGGAGARGFRRIVVATDVDPPASPCGACRQLLAEFGLDLEVISVGPRTERRWVLRDLLPDAFAKTALSP